MQKNRSKKPQKSNLEYLEKQNVSSGAYVDHIQCSCWLAMDDEVVIIEAEPKITDFNTFDIELGHDAGTCNYEKELYEVNQPITHRPEYVAIRDSRLTKLSHIWKRTNCFQR